MGLAIKVLKSKQKQKTIKKKIVFHGQSLFSTENISMELLPADEDFGIRF
ncbi:MAG: UDP-3-O-acyl-N-acetylglucosamine deacetylase, partial [Candidatus Methanofastidiosum sp.]|nr:UDP-3-O-acyl-N-acetylglucosamine deacetylase [Methanofastidiosum sp.]